MSIEKIKDYFIQNPHKSDLFTIAKIVQCKTEEEFKELMLTE